MKHKIGISKIDWDFKVNDIPVRIRWTFIEKREHAGIMASFYQVIAIFPNHLNRVSEEKFETCLQINMTNSLYFLKKILKIK